ncbi:hypothetical protein D3C77_335560 [compost metagenome]
MRYFMTAAQPSTPKKISVVLHAYGDTQEHTPTYRPPKTHEDAAKNNGVPR